VRVKIPLILFALLAFADVSRAAGVQFFSVIFTLKQNTPCADEPGQQEAFKNGNSTMCAGGASLRADAAEMVYVGADKALHIVEIASGKDRMILASGSNHLADFDTPSIAPDGRRVVFAANSGMHPDSDKIYSVQSDGKGLMRLPQSKPVKQQSTVEYDMPSYFPDGSQILARQSIDAIKSVSSVAMSPDGSGLHTLTDGPLWCWEHDGKAIFVLGDDDDIIKYNVTSRTSDVLKGLAQDPPLGDLSGHLAFECYGWLCLRGMTERLDRMPRVLPVPLRIPDDIHSTILTPASEDLEALKISTTPSGNYALLEYSNHSGSRQAFQILKIDQRALAEALGPADSAVVH
jgi:hypothetical protein